MYRDLVSAVFIMFGGFAGAMYWAARSPPRCTKRRRERSLEY